MPYSTAVGGSFPVIDIPFQVALYLVLAEAFFLKEVLHSSIGRIGFSFQRIPAFIKGISFGLADEVLGNASPTMICGDHEIKYLMGLHDHRPCNLPVMLDNPNGS